MTGGNSNTSTVQLILKGAAMGIAEVIPGVSGGTIAFISGIYERLIDSIKNITGLVMEPSLLLNPKELWKRIDGGFLSMVFGGMLLGLVVGIFGISYLLEHYPEPLWGFFFGLILASVVYLLGEIKPLNLSNYIAVIIGAIIAYMIVTVAPAEGTGSLVFVFIAGAIAICALVLPGVSGSFILLLMGMYSIIIPAVKDVLSMNDLSKLSLIVVFGLGCVTGLFLFSRLIHWLLNNYKNNTLALMTGFMLGSLYKIWPWRNPVSLMDRDSHALVQWTSDQFDLSRLHDFRVLVEQNVMPGDYWGEPRTMLAIVGAVVGMVVVLGLSKMEADG